MSPMLLAGTVQSPTTDHTIRPTDIPGFKPFTAMRPFYFVIIKYFLLDSKITMYCSSVVIQGLG